MGRGTRAPDATSTGAGTNRCRGAEEAEEGLEDEANDEAAAASLRRRWTATFIGAADIREQHERDFNGHKSLPQ